MITRLDNGNLLVPKRAEVIENPEALTTRGDGMEEITPDHPDYQAWIQWMEFEDASSSNHPS